MSTATRVAAVDCGTNSVRLLIADIVDGRLTDLERRMEIVRLGQGVDKTGRLAPEALDRTFAAMRGYAKLIATHDVTGTPIRTRVVATSATRDASNRDDFVRGVVDIFGVEPEVVTGEEEARLSFIGATKDLSALRPMRPYLVVDIGGGSTEFVFGTGEVEAARSVDIGCVRLTERHLRSDPPSPEQVAAAVADIDAALASVRDGQAAQETAGVPGPPGNGAPGADPAAARALADAADPFAAARALAETAPARPAESLPAVPVAEARTLVGLAGSVTTVAGIALDLPAYDSERIHLSRIKARQVHDVTRTLLRSTHDERGRIGVMHPGRVDVIGAGALILDRIMREYAFADVIVSERDILDGIAWSLV
ncbi:Ppx/GppA family phosphatase [Actinoallomurus spadix]|uniref:Ppx/GppA phosphatase family protein n=1 Tax=Actinoallomurus spadix TaxID=79912 RepID=A0ABP3GXK0_9ACTN|nr:Ppx/GppA phosphatase family protein [Actinoallomurus spadix]MCO5986910.1 Ppx/GppA family phosphatase [Actinoallomurus spadix]